MALGMVSTLGGTGSIGLCPTGFSAKALLLPCSSVAQRCCPWGVRSPRGEFLRERGRLKIVALGSRPIFLLLCSSLPHALVWRGPEGSLSWAAPVSFTQTQPPPLPLPVAPGSKKGRRVEGLLLQQTPRARAAKPGALSSS